METICKNAGYRSEKLRRIVLAWVLVTVLVWVFSGGLRRKFLNQPPIRAGIGIVIQQPTQPTPVLFQDDDDD